MTHALYTAALACIAELARLGIAVEVEIALRVWLGQERGRYITRGK